MEIEFCNLSYTVKTHFNIVGRKKTILKNVNGKFMPGELCAVLGTSGAGKTTLLHALTGYRKSGVSGSLLVNGKSLNEHYFRRKLCYITQEQRLPSHITLNEAMHLASRLKISGGSSNREQIVKEILEWLGLSSVGETMTDLLSGGQKRRATLALELLTRPPACVLDEPCSGLDDVSAAKTLKLLKRLANAGRTVIVTLHQPSAAQLNHFKRLYVLAGGKCVYHGTPHGVVEFLARLGYHCPTTHNPADFIIELVDQNPETIEDLSKAIENGKKYFEEVDFCTQIPELLPTTNWDRKLQEYNWINLNSSSNMHKDKSLFAISSSKQFVILLERYLQQTVRNKSTLCIQAVHYLLCAFLVAAVFYDSAENGALMFNHLKCFVGITLFYSYTRFLIPIIMLPDEIKMAKMEHFNQWYRMTPYFFASMIASFPIQFIYNFIFISIVYYFIGLPMEVWRFSMHVIIVNMISIATDGLGVAVASIFNPTLGLIIGPSISSIFLGLAIYGFDFAKKIGFLMRMIMKTSPTRLGLSSLVIVTFGWGRQTLKCDEIFCYFADPKTLLDYLGGADNDIYSEMGTLFALMVFFRIIAYVALKWRFRT